MQGIRYILYDIKGGFISSSHVGDLTEKPSSCHRLGVSNNPKRESC